MSAQPAETVTLSVGRGQVVRLATPMSDLFVADDKVADVQVRSSTQLYVFAKAAGETTVYATNKAGQTVFSANIRVGANYGSVGSMLQLAMPEASITATPMNGLVLLTGTVASPGDVEEAQALVQAFVGKETQVVSRLKTATPLQVNLHVKIAEVSRELAKQVGVNLLSRDTTGGFLFGIAQGRGIGSIGNTDLSVFPNLDASSIFGLPAGSISLPFNPGTGQFINPAKPGTVFDLRNLGQGAGATNLGLAGKLFGVDIASAIDLAEQDGLVTTLAEPNLTALSGETASFLAGGEVPIPISQALGTVSVEYKQYGVSLAFTPTVLADGRISMRVRPEVSELSSAGAVTLNGFSIPGFTTRRAETTIELGSGQAFMIGGLLRNNTTNATDKAPFLGDLPILGALFRSNSFRRNETELVIVVTPYLVRPVNANQIVLPTDGYKAPTDVERILGGQSFSGKSGGQRPKPTLAPPVTATVPPAPRGGGKAKADGAAAPGFSL
ncbi:type II and III secretion system protein family protein [Sphingomonas solaris]|uniref:Type II and III secretion system protein family protein n=1 Tax=Alterirhizorhabdus solaris TaxID=2529389 RepID=A0A558QSY2_9SPHN|nr:type II and III secretion system protein family protein [Sphingomonas solaris]TVV70256.1 type II and III secretion system protein family protein [Sphingomonas solaris]